MAVRSAAVASVPTTGKLLVSAALAQSDRPIIVWASSTSAWLAGGATEQLLPVGANALFGPITLYNGDDLWGASASSTVTIDVMYSGGS